MSETTNHADTPPSARPTRVRRFDARRLIALVRKESGQLIRDPSSLLIAFVLPAVLLFLFAYAVSLDIRQVRLGVVLETDAAPAHALAAAFAGTRYFQVTPARDRHAMADALVAGDLRGYVVIPQDFMQRLQATDGRPLLQIITDGTQPNTANFVAHYAQGVVDNWQQQRRLETGDPAGAATIALEPRFWFNPEIDTRRALIPGAIAIVMTIIGTLLTAMVVAREWERGTMEAIMSTPASVAEILLGKLIPYFVLGMAATVGATLLALFVFDVPLRGSWLALLLLSAVFLVPALGQGLLISALARNQFIAAQIALLSGFLPAFLLSGFLYEIDAMPWPIRLLTYVVPARYFVACLQTVFLAGDVWALFLPSLAAMLAIGALFFAVALRRTRKTLDT